MDEQLFNAEHEVKSQFVKWGVIGDWFKGTLTEIREQESQLPDQAGKMMKIYDFIADSGSFHGIDENKKPLAEATVIVKGDRWIVGGKIGIDNQMRNIRIGQIVGMKFVEERPSKQKGYNPQKVIRVYAGGMDPNFHGDLPGDEIDPNEAVQ